MLICPRNETVTLVSGKVTRANFKTVSFATLAMHHCSAEDLDLLKYATAALNFLSNHLSS